MYGPPQSGARQREQADSQADEIGFRFIRKPDGVGSLGQVYCPKVDVCTLDRHRFRVHGGFPPGIPGIAYDQVAWGGERGL